MSKKVVYTPQEVAGLKLLAFAIKRNVERVERRYRNRATREACQALALAADAIIEHAEGQARFTLFVAHQPTWFDYSSSDVAYGVEDTQADDDVDTWVDLD